MSRSKPHTSKSKILLFLGVLLVVLVMILPKLLSNPPIHLGKGSATYYFVNSQDVTLDQTFTVELHAKINNLAANAVEAHLSFDPQMLSILNMDTSSSFCTMYADNSFDANKGLVDIACGTPSPGFEGDSTILKLTFRSLNWGSTKISMLKNNADILANDGKGTNMLTNIPSTTINIVQSY